MRTVIIASLALALAGCYMSHGRGSADVSIDPVADPDVDPDPDPEPEDPVIDEPEEEVCEPTSVMAWRIVPDVLILLDRSNSMAYEPPTPSMWVTIRTALANLSEPPMDEDIWFGLMTFPGRACTGGGDPTIDCTAPSASEVLVRIGPDNHTRLESTLSGMSVCGGTPIADTLEAAGTYLSGLTDHHPRYLLLATDGAPNCNLVLDGSTCTCTADYGCGGSPWNCLDDLRTYAVLEEMCDEGVQTFVLGLGGSVRWTGVYAEMARRGCTGGYFLAEDLDEIDTALEEIATRVAECQIELACADITDPSEVNFAIEPEHVTIPRDPSHSYGWDWVDPCDGGVYGLVEFYGVDCSELFRDDLAHLGAETGCPTIFP